MTTTTQTEHDCSFPCNPPGGTFFAPGPCLTCGKSYERAQAEILLTAAVKAMDATEPDERLGYEYETVNDLRRGLVSSAVTWQETADRYCEGRKETQAAADAYVSSLMAGCYSYTLAAVLGVAATEYGEAVAKHLAWFAASVMIDGDSDDLNADVAPEGSDPRAATSPATEATETRK